MKLLLATVLLLSWGSAHAGWEFSAPIDVTAARGEKVFHHVESAGRKSIAAGSDSVAVVWEDNRDGTPRCYFVRKKFQDAQFSPETQLSGSGACYEPTVVALDADRFVAAFEENGRVRARLITPERIGDPLDLATGESAQATLGAARDQIYAAWSEKDGAFTRIHSARLTLTNDTLRIAHRGAVETAPIKDDQLYPSIAPAANGEVVVIWDDRRFGHTSIVYAHSTDGKKFSTPRDVNEAFRGSTRNLGRGSGAMRGVLARQDDKRVVVVWLDKRDFLSGYDVYAAHSSDGGRTFGKNQKVQDSFGDTFAQWHATVAARGDHIVVMWDDERDETPDVWISTRGTDGWIGDDKAAAGPGAQTDPVIALDDAGRLHVVWIEREEINGPTRLRYAHGEMSK